MASFSCLFQGCSNPTVPQELSVPDAARLASYPGIVIHSSQFRLRLDDILALVGPKEYDEDKSKGTVLVVGGGKSAME